VLRVHDLGLARREAEEGGVEILNAVEEGAGADVGGIGQQCRIDPRGQQLVVVEEGDRLHAVAEVLPESLQGRGAGEADGHTDDRNALGLGIFTHEPDLSLRPRRLARA